MRLSLPRLGRWPRLLAIGACLLLALAGALHARRSATDPQRHDASVVVAARRVAAGHRITAGDVRVARWPARLLPRAPSRVSAVVGRRAAGPIARGEPVLAGRLIGDGLTAGLPPGRAAVPVTLADAHAADLLRPGQRVDLLAVPDPDALGVLDGSAGLAGVGDTDDTDDTGGTDGTDGTDGTGSTDGATGAGSTASGVHRVAASLLVLAVLPGTDVTPAGIVVAAAPATALRLAGTSRADVLTAVSVSP